MTEANPSYHRRDLYNDVTARILTELETGAAPWVKPWSATPGLNHPHNAATSRPYSGCNVVLLWMAAERQGYSTPRYLTFKQAQELGGSVRKGEHGTKVLRGFHNTGSMDFGALDCQLGPISPKKLRNIV
jgi:antirestriction protein ArdC